MNTFASNANDGTTNRRTEAGFRLLFIFALVFTATPAVLLSGSSGKRANTAARTMNTDSLRHSPWFDTVVQAIEKKEYDLALDTKTHRVTSPNLKQNLLFSYSRNGFSVKPLMMKIPLFDCADKSIKKEAKNYRILDDWDITLTLAGHGRGERIIPFEGGTMNVRGRTATVNGSSVTIRYTNSEQGMRQDFIVKKKPSGKGKLRLRLEIQTELRVQAAGDEIAFFNKKNKREMYYNGLKVRDMTGRKIAAEMKETGDKRIDICVNDTGAVYPITIDPLSTTESWSATGENTNELFGFCVATAGDVNGDGYSDVIVGAYGYGDPFPAVPYIGKAYLYEGSSSGLSTSASWTATGENVNDYFGYSVATAGDVNGDGYSDVIVGAYGFGNGLADTGKVYCYYGSSSGLSTNASWTHLGEISENQFG
jgi:hypothetical protein